MDKLTKDTIKACEQYGAYTVRKAAIRQQKGDNQALEEVGLAHHAHEYNNLLDISTIAFYRMSGEEVLDEFMTSMSLKRNSNGS